MNHLNESELILNEDGSIYHLNLLPEQLADTIITVGDPDRVDQITQHFDSIEFKIRKREFYTQTGIYRGKRLSVISTGIGTDNIDIVLNELDALVNINLKTREIKESLTSLNIIRIGTSGAIQPEIPVDSFLFSEMAVGFDTLLQYYRYEDVKNKNFQEALKKHLNHDPEKAVPYIVSCDSFLSEKFSHEKLIKGITATNVGFYAPQGRVLRLPLRDGSFNEKISSFRYSNRKITNLEMETSGIYGLAKLLGHKALSLNAIIANRATGKFSSDPAKTIDGLILFCLDTLAESDLTEH